MTRRRFLEGFMTAGSAVLGVAWSLAKAVPRKFLRAKPLARYPGRLKAIGDITSQAKWSG